MTHVFEENAELWVGLWVDCCLEDGEENILQHLAKVGHKVPASEDVTKIKRDVKKKLIQLTLRFSHWSGEDLTKLTRSWGLESSI